MSSMPTVASASTIVVGLSGLLPCADAMLCGVDTVGPIAVRVHPGRVEQHGDLARRRHLARRHQGELVQQALRVLHDADHPRGMRRPSVSVLPMPQVQLRGHPAGHRDLARAGRVVPGDQGQQRLPVRAVRVLRAQVVGVDRAGDGHRLVLDHVDRCGTGCCSAAIWLARCGSGAWNVAMSVAVPKPALAGGRRVRGRRRADHDRGHRDHDQPQHQQLLAPLAAEHPPRPADHGPARGHAPVPGAARRAAGQPLRAVPCSLGPAPGR